MRQPLSSVAAAIEPVLISALLGSASFCKGLTSMQHPDFWPLVKTFTDTQTPTGVPKSASVC